MITAKLIDGVTKYFDDGVEITLAEAKTAVASEPEVIAETNKRSLESKANTALTNNATYLNLASPTNAQNLAQIRALTRQNNALIRLLLKKLDSTTGT